MIRTQIQMEDDQIEWLSLGRSKVSFSEPQMRRAIIMSGFTQKELHKFMGVYRLAELPSQLWAILTPISENWSITHVLDKLAAESEAIKKQREGPKRPIHK